MSFFMNGPIHILKGSKIGDKDIASMEDVNNLENRVQPKIHIGPTAPPNPSENDIWIQI